MKKIVIHYYTDPLCCWSWAMAPVLEQLDKVFNGSIEWHYHMGGLLPGWKSFSDPVNSVNRPLQMGPVWMHAAQVGNVPIDHHIWLKDPPASSYLACMAFKAVEMQSNEYAISFFYRMQESCLQNGINISGYDRLVALANDLKKEYPSFDVDAFKLNLTNGESKKRFQQDLNEVASLKIQRFPTMILRQEDKPSILITGYRPLSELSQVVRTHFIVQQEATHLAP